MTLPSGRRDLIECIFLSIEILLVVGGFIFLAFYIFPGKCPIDSGSRTKYGVLQDSASQTVFSRFPNTSSSLRSNVTITLQPFEYTMTVDHFSNLISKAYQPGIPTIQSTSFPVGQPFSFYLSILPNGDEEAGFIAIFVTQNKEGHWNRSDQLYFCISLLDANREKRFTETAWHTFEPTNPDLGWPQFLSHEELLNSVNELLPNDTLTVVLEAFHISPQNSKPQVALEPVQIGQHQAPPTWMVTFMENDYLSDFKFDINGTIIPAHRFALAAASPVFKTLFESDTTSIDSKFIRLPYMNLPLFRAFLKYVYTGTVEEVAKYDLELLIVAVKYQMVPLLEMCHQSIISNRLSLETATQLLFYSKRYQATNLTLTIHKFIESSLDRSFKRLLDEPLVAIEVARILVDLEKYHEFLKAKK